MCTNCTSAVTINPGSNRKPNAAWVDKSKVKEAQMSKNKELNGQLLMRKLTPK